MRRKPIIAVVLFAFAAGAWAGSETGNSLVSSGKAASAVEGTLLAKMEAVAQQTGVKLLGAEWDGEALQVSLAWAWGNAARGGDFIEECHRQGLIRDLDLKHTGAGIIVVDGVEMFSAQYRLFPA